MISEHRLSAYLKFEIKTVLDFSSSVSACFDSVSASVSATMVVSSFLDFFSFSLDWLIIGSVGILNGSTGAVIKHKLKKVCTIRYEKTSIKFLWILSWPSKGTCFYTVGVVTSYIDGSLVILSEPFPNLDSFYM